MHKDHVLEVILVLIVHQNHALLGSSNKLVDHQIDDQTHIQEISEYIVCHMLEDRWRISEAERHDCILEVPISSAKRGLPVISWSDLYEVVGST